MVSPEQKCVCLQLISPQHCTIVHSAGRRLPASLKWSVIVHAVLGQSYTFLLLSSNLLMPFMLKFVVESYEKRYNDKLSESGEKHRRNASA